MRVENQSHVALPPLAHKYAESVRSCTRTSRHCSLRDLTALRTSYVCEAQAPLLDWTSPNLSRTSVNFSKHAWGLRRLRSDFRPTFDVNGQLIRKSKL